MLLTPTPGIRAWILFTTATSTGCRVATGSYISTLIGNPEGQWNQSYSEPDPAIDAATLDRTSSNPSTYAATLFMADRQRRLLTLIEAATGKRAYVGDLEDDGEDVDTDREADETPST